MQRISFLEQFAQCFAPAPFRRLARETGWQQRTGKIDPFEFVAGLVFAQMSALRQIQQAGAFFLTPLPRSVKAWCLDAAGNYQLLDLARALRAATTPTVEWEVRLGAGGAQGVPVRLVAFRLSEESANRRRAALREAQRRLGRTPTAEALELAGWLLLITNAPADKLPTAAMSYLYRARWQIELVFRTTKSVLRLDQTQGQKALRVRCEIWARLIAAVVVFLWHGHVQAAAWRQGRWEVSFEKLARHLQQHGLSLALALVQGGRQLGGQLRRLWRQLLVGARKGRRKRHTTWQLLQAYWLDMASG